MECGLNGKIAVVINGKGGSGKDTICDIVANHYNVKNISSITPIKEIARIYGGYDGGKELKDRKFLSDLKQLFTDYNDLPNAYCVNQFKEFMADGELEVFFAHIREPENIKKFVESVDGRCVTLLIRGGKSRSDVYGNRSDDDVEDYPYDFIFDNIGSLENLDADFMNFFENLKSEVEKNYYPHEM